MGETNSPSVAHMGHDTSPLSRVKPKIPTTRLTACGQNFQFNSLEWRNIATHGQPKENLYLYWDYCNKTLKWYIWILILGI